MKKIIILIACFSFASHSFAFNLVHKHKNKISHGLKLKQKSQDFSGTWVGNCDGEEGQVTIKQNEQQIVLEFPDEDKTVSFSFALNKLATFSSGSSISNRANLNNAILMGNRLELTYTDMSIKEDKNGSTWINKDLIFLEIEKKDNTLIISDDYDFSQPSCTLTKIN